MATVRTVGERAVLVEVERPLPAAHWIRTTASEQGLDVVEVVPAACTVLVSVAAPARQSDLRRILATLPEDLEADAAADNPVVEIAVHYDGPDLDEVAERSGLTPRRIAEELQNADLVAAFCGFAPGFAYLTGVPDALRLARRSDPRTRVPAGSLAVADGYAAIYPRESPGGWHLLGTTDAVLFDVERDPPALVQPGTRVRLIPR